MLAAWPFRWEKGPTQTVHGSDEDLKIVHLRDRWTGQNWLVYYGWHGEEVYSGETYPHLNEEVIAKEASLILKSPEGRKKKQDLEAKLAEAKEEKKKHSYGHTQYLRLAEQLKAKLESPYDDPWLTATDPVWQMEAEQIVRPSIPPELVKECDAWRNANRRVKKLTEQINKLPEWAQKEAKKRLTQEAYRKRNIATGIWAGLVGISLLTSVYLFVREKRKNDSRLL
ncbi:MAG: Uncharacterized protein XD50_1348 [Clostridia bacterium 41_269]|nr:MAG: Uncharacterized protein XD50_1348 [Clostridia bacterium 41_269]